MTQQQRWAEIGVDAGGDAQEIVGALLTEVAGCHGYATTAMSVAGYLPVDERLENTLLTLRASLDAVPGLSFEITIRFVAEEDWASAWKQYFKPQRIGERIVIKPTWEDWDAKPGEVVVQIDPGMAFGTGLHGTTRLCLHALEERVTPGATVADVGTGSGILAVAAALLGASQVTATEIDPLAVRIAQENIALNGVAQTVSVTEAAAPPTGTFDIVVANILADVILSMAPALLTALRPGGGLLIASGIIDTRAGDVQAGLTKAGFTDLETRTEGEWAALLARRP